MQFRMSRSNPDSLHKIICIIHFMGLVFLDTVRGRQWRTAFPVLFEGIDERTCKLSSAENNVPAMCIKRFTDD